MANSSKTFNEAHDGLDSQSMSKPEHSLNIVAICCNVQAEIELLQQAML